MFRINLLFKKKKKFHFHRPSRKFYHLSIHSQNFLILKKISFQSLSLSLPLLRSIIIRHATNDRGRKRWIFRWKRGSWLAPIGLNPMGGGEGAKLKRARAELKRTMRTGWQFHATRLTISISIGHRDYLDVQ